MFQFYISHDLITLYIKVKLNLIYLIPVDCIMESGCSSSMEQLCLPPNAGGDDVIKAMLELSTNLSSLLLGDISVEAELELVGFWAPLLFLLLPLPDDPVTPDI